MTTRQQSHLHHLLLLVTIAAILVHEASSFSAPSPLNIVSSHLEKETKTKGGESQQPLTATILCVPLDSCADDVVFTQVATGGRSIQGLAELRKCCKSFDSNFQSEFGVSSSVRRVSSVSPDEVLVQWNVTWIPPTSAWLEALGNALPGVKVVPSPYNDQSSKISTFSWKAVGRLFQDVIESQRLRVPQACIEGTNRLRFEKVTDKSGDSGNYLLKSITEDLSYAQDLRRGALSNRKCANDLRLFLETGRRITNEDDQQQSWDDVVATCLPWQSVPGSNVLDIDPNEEGPAAAYVALGLSAIITVAFANFIGPLLIGQSLFGPPNYIVPPSEFMQPY